MRWFRDVIGRLRTAFRPRRIDRDLQDELESHLAMEADELRRRGHEPGAAARVAVLRAGGVAPAMDALRDERGLSWLLDAVRDVRYACRGLLRARGLAAVAVVSLALGIGASTLIFSIVDAALLRPLPYRDADRLVDMQRVVETVTGARARIRVDGSRIDQIRAMSQVFEGAAALSDAGSLALADGPEISLGVGAFAPGFPAFLGIAPQLGRDFTDDDVTAGDRIVISDAYWSRAFNRDPDVIGATVPLASGARVIVGVMPPTFRYFVGGQTDAWLPTAEGEASQVVARVRAGLTIDEAQRELNVLLARPDAAWKPLGIEIQPGDWNRAGQYFGQGGRSTRAMLSSLFGAVGLLLVIGCANVANLLLSRTLARQRDIAIRRSLGATRVRVALQLLTDGFLLAGIGTAAAAVLVWWGIHALPSIVPAELALSAFSVGLPQFDARALAFGGMVSACSALVCGSASAARAFASDAAGDVLAGGQRVAGPTRAVRRTHAAFQTMQVAMTVVLLAGAGLLLASVYRMATMPPGFDPTNLGYASLDFSTVGWTGRAGLAPRGEFLDSLATRVKAMPGITDAIVGQLPVAGFANQGFLPEAPGEPVSDPVRTSSYYVGSDYFAFVGTRIVAGRSFDGDDARGGPPVAIVSEHTARQVWPSGDWIGQRFQRWGEADEPFLTVVGVAEDVRAISLMEDEATVYLPIAQAFDPGSILFRTTGDEAAAIAVVRTAARAVNPKVTVTAVGTVDGFFERRAPIGVARFYGAFLSLFAIVALTIAMIGLYGTLSYSVSRRRHEIGVRLALGASAARVRGMMAREILAPVVVGLVAGVAASLWASRFIASQLFQVEPHDPVILGTIVLLLTLASVVAAIVPTRRAAQVDPAQALRAE